MKVEDMILDSLIEFAIGDQIPESKLFDLTDKNDLNNIQYSRLCEMVTMLGYDIVPDSEIHQVKTKDKTIESTAPFSYIIQEFEKLSMNQKYKCLIKLAVIIAEQDKNANVNIAEQFIGKLQKMNLQYSYIAVLIKAFLTRCNALGQAKIDDLIDYYDEFYMSRLNNNLISEQDDSILGKKGFNKSDIRKIILYNPMKRSFLRKYFDYHNDSGMVCINDALWNSLNKVDKTSIEMICNLKLDEYYKKLLLK